MSPVVSLTSEETEILKKALRSIGVADDAQFIGITWARFKDRECNDWEAESAILTPEADPFLARAAGLALTHDILAENFAGIRKPLSEEFSSSVPEC